MLHLWKELAPELEGDFFVCPADDGNEVILPGLDGFFGNVSLMIIGRNKLIGHARVFDGFFMWRIFCCLKLVKLG